MSEIPKNIQEFNQITGFILARLYEVHPHPEDINQADLATQMGIPAENWAAHVLPSGRPFGPFSAETIGWLNNQDYIKAHGLHIASRVILTDKGFRSLNAAPVQLNGPVGTKLTEEARKGPFADLSAIGDLIGGLFGGFTKSMSSGS
jgi:hypothetical protein